MKKLFVAFALLSTAAFAESWSGTISDSHCGAKHVAATEKDAACVDKCMKGGADPVFVVGDKVYKIANAEAVKGHEGHKVTITGKLDGDTVQVDSVKM